MNGAEWRETVREILEDRGVEASPADLDLAAELLREAEAVQASALTRIREALGQDAARIAADPLLVLAYDAALRDAGLADRRAA